MSLIIGEKYHKLTVKALVVDGNANQRKYLCICDCGNEGVTTTEAIQIPKGHGRIGDLDELQVNVTKVMTYGDALHEIKKAPILLESEVMPDE